MHEHKWYDSGNTDEKGMGGKEREGMEWNRKERNKREGIERKEKGRKAW